MNWPENWMKLRVNILSVRSRNIHLIVNPVAGNGKAKVAAQKILQKSDKITGTKINITYSKCKNDATTITRDAISDRADLIVALGGDGTINEVVNGFFEDGKQIHTNCELGIIDCGTGKGYASTLRIPSSIDQQIDLLFGSSRVESDLGFISCQGQSGEMVERYFINECQIGIGSRVASIVGRKYKMFGGRIAFGLAATIQAMIIKTVEVEISFDNGPFKEYFLIGLVVGNGTECAGGMKLTPNARLDDGLFDVLLIHEMSTLKRLLNLSKVYSGAHVSSNGFSIRKCKSLKIRSKSKILLEADGEILGHSPFDIKILPSALKVKTD